MKYQAKTIVILLSWNNADLTVNCLKSLNGNVPDDLLICWFDNGSDESEYKKVVDYINTTDLKVMSMRNETNVGFVKAVNYCWRGAKAYGAEQIILLNNDTEVPEKWLDRLEEGVKQGYDIVGAISSKSEIGWQAINNLVDKWEFMNVPVVDNYQEQDKILRDKFKDGIYPVGNMVAFFATLITKKVWDKIGILSEDYGMGFGDDDDYCLRARHAGFKIGLHLGLCIRHHHRATFKLLKEKTGYDYVAEQNKNIELFKRRAKDVLST